MNETWQTLTAHAGEWVKLPSGRYLNMARATEVGASEEGDLVVYFGGGAGAYFAKNADAKCLRAWLDATAQS